MNCKHPRFFQVVSAFLVAILLFSCSSPASISHVHSIVIDEMVSATCYSPGLTAGSHCSACGEVIQEQEAIPLAPHNIVVDPMVDSTCISSGLTKGSHCSVCGKVFEQQEVIPFSDHQFVVDESVASTCHSAGLTEGSHCSVCGYVAKQQETIPVIAHTVGEIITDNPATCTETGKLIYKCSICGEEQTEIINAKGHTYGEWVTLKNPSCTIAGQKKRVCTTCNNAQTETISATGHKATRATCTEDGKCSTCGQITEKALGHLGSFGEKCSRCGKTVGPNIKMPSTPFYVTQHRSQESYLPIEGGYKIIHKADYGWVWTSEVLSEMRIDKIEPTVYYDGRNDKFTLKIFIEGEVTYRHYAQYVIVLLDENGKTIGSNGSYMLSEKVGERFSFYHEFMVDIAFANPSRYLQLKILTDWEADAVPH